MRYSRQHLLASFDWSLREGSKFEDRGKESKREKRRQKSLVKVPKDHKKKKKKKKKMLYVIPKSLLQDMNLKIHRRVTKYMDSLFKFTKCKMQTVIDK